MLVCDLLYRREVLLCRVEVVDCYLIHRDVHYGAVSSMPVVAMEVWLPYVWYSAIALDS